MKWLVLLLAITNISCISFHRERTKIHHVDLPPGFVR